MDASQWPQGIGVVPDQHHNKAMEPAAAAASRSPNNNNLTAERRARPQKDQALNCPRCNSTNTKFCYYNNYSLSQPRYFCKTCRRYWTEGGSLRNVPVGGGSRKNKRASSSPSLSNNSKKLVPEQHLVSSVVPKINMTQAHQDLNLGYPPAVLAVENQNPSSCSSSSPHFSAVELLKSTAGGPMGMGSFIHMAGSDSGTMFAGGFPIQEFKPTLNFCLDRFNQGGGGEAHENGGGARLLFPVEDLKHVSAPSHHLDHHQRDHHGGHHQGYWTGMLGENSW